MGGGENKVRKNNSLPQFRVGKRLPGGRNHVNAFARFVPGFFPASDIQLHTKRPISSVRETTVPLVAPVLLRRLLFFMVHKIIFSNPNFQPDCGLKFVAVFATAEAKTESMEMAALFKRYF
jgi:hypothetical protein